MLNSSALQITQNFLGPVLASLSQAQTIELGRGLSDVDIGGSGMFFSSNAVFI